MRIAGSSESIAPYVPAADSPVPAPDSASSAGQSDFARVLRGIGGELDRGEALSARAIHAGSSSAHLSPEQLLALQAGVYRYSEAVDLVTKLVDRGTQAVKTVVQNQ
jgi:hypothetical protein